MKILLGVLLLCCIDLSHNSSLRQVRQATPGGKLPDPKEKRVVCYYANWSIYRTGDSKFGPENIHPHLCTHVLYAFATLEKDVGVVPFDPKQDIQLEGYAKFIELKKANPKLQLILSVGGSKEGSARFSKIAADPQLRSSMAKNGRVFLQQFGFDGLDLVWQYPAFADGSSSSDKANYVQLVKELKDEFKDDLSISVVLPSLIPLIDRGFDLPELSKYVDFMSIVTYDYHVATDATVHHVAPLYALPQDTDKNTNVDATIRAYLNLNADPSKLNLGIPLYGVSFILDDPEETDIGAETADEGPGIQERGAIIYNDFCKKINEELWTVRHVNKSAMGPYAYKGQRWVAYDDQEMIKTKANYAVEKGIGGLMFWSIDMDDFKGICHSRAFPLIKAGREAFLDKPPVRNNKPIPTADTMTIPTPASDQTQSTSQLTPTEPSPTTEPVGVSLASQPRPPQPRPPQPRPVQPRPVRPRPETPLPSETDNTIGDTDIDTQDQFQFPANNRSFYSNRDIVFQNIKIWINNHYN